MLKKELRLKYKALRKALDEKSVEENSLAIANMVLKLPIWNQTYFHVFLPIVSQKEVNTEMLLHLISGKDKEIVLSKSDFSTRKMSHFLLTDNTKMKVNDYGIPEPLDGIEVPVHKIDVVFVPLLAYDTLGNRVGYGKGFYDTFLSECKPDVLKIGLSFFEPEIEISNLYDSDVKLDFCVTPTTIYQFK